MGRPRSGSQVLGPHSLGGPDYTPVCAWKLSKADVVLGQRGLWKAWQIRTPLSLSFCICNLGESSLLWKAG